MLRMTNFYLNMQEGIKDKFWGIFSEQQIKDVFNRVDLKKGYDIQNPQKVCLALNLLRPR